jgi:ABC-type transport system involved in cytochrome bd biosynthesis fused ATPase/permease subunit
MDPNLWKRIDELFEAALEQPPQIVIIHVVVEKGKIVEQGTHEELMERQGLYYYLSSQQLSL